MALIRLTGSPWFRNPVSFTKFIRKMHYVLRWLHGGRNEELHFAGDAFHPIAQSPESPVHFELVAYGKSINSGREAALGGISRRSIDHIYNLTDEPACPSSFSSRESSEDLLRKLPLAVYGAFSFSH